MRKEAGKGSGWKGRTKQLYLHGHNDFDYYVQFLSVKIVSFSSSCPITCHAISGISRYIWELNSHVKVGAHKETD